MSAEKTQELAKLRSKLRQKLGEVLAPEAIIEEPESQRPFECDGLSLYCDLPLVVVLPSTVDQVQSILRICHDLGVPVVPRGSGTGLCAGAMPHPEGILLGLSKLNKIVEIDPIATEITVCGQSV